LVVPRSIPIILLIVRSPISPAYPPPDLPVGSFPIDGMPLESLPEFESSS
jgi:hypothetical protein